MLEDIPKTVLAVLTVALAAAGTWTWLDRRSRAAAAARRLWQPPARGWLVVLLASVVFTVLAEDAVKAEHQELVIQLNQYARAALKTDDRVVRPVAATISRLTGPGLFPVVLGAVAVLALRRRLREGLVVAIGTLSAWGVSGLLKLALGVPRPRAKLVGAVYSSFGFPSGHALVTLVALGLIAWAFLRRAARAAQASAAVATALVTAVTGLARVIVDAHWLSDVLGGIAFGIVWLALAVRVGRHVLDEASASQVSRRSASRMPWPAG
jgi:hypothetical protein